MTNKWHLMCWAWSGSKLFDPEWLTLYTWASQYTAHYKESIARHLFWLLTRFDFMTNWWHLMCWAWSGSKLFDDTLRVFLNDLCYTPGQVSIQLITSVNNQAPFLTINDKLMTFNVLGLIWFQTVWPWMIYVIHMGKSVYSSLQGVNNQAPFLTIN